MNYCSRALQRNKTFRARGEMDWLRGIGSCKYGSWGVPLSAICKLETRKRQRCNSNQGQRHGNQESRWFEFQSKGRKRRDVSAQNWGRKKQANPSFLCLLLCSGRVDWMMPSPLGRAIWWLRWLSLCHCHSGEFNNWLKYCKANSEWKHRVNMQIQFLMYHNEQQTYLMNYFQKNKFKYHLQ